MATATNPKSLLPRRQRKWGNASGSMWLAPVAVNQWWAKIFQFCWLSASVSRFLDRSNMSLRSGCVLVCRWCTVVVFCSAQIVAKAMGNVLTSCWPLSDKRMPGTHNGAAQRFRKLWAMWAQEIRRFGMKEINLPYHFLTYTTQLCPTLVFLVGKKINFCKSERALVRSNRIWRWRVILVPIWDDVQTWTCRTVLSMLFNTQW